MNEDDKKLYKSMTSSPYRVRLHEGILFPEVAKQKDDYERENKHWLDWKNISGKIKTLSNIDYADFFYELKRSAETNTPIANDIVISFAHKLDEKRRAIKDSVFKFSAGKFNPKAKSKNTKCTDPVVIAAEYVNEFLENFGFSIEFNGVEKDGVKSVFYTPSDFFKKMLQIIELRAASRSGNQSKQELTINKQEPVSEPLTGYFDYSKEPDEQIEVSFIGDIDITSYDYSPNLDECPPDFFEDCPEFDGPPDDFYTEEYIASLQEIHQLD